jgi:hypothetical protein
MRRMLIRFILLGSLLLFVAAVVWGVRGYWKYDDFREQLGPLRLEQLSAEGCLHLEVAIRASAAAHGRAGWDTQDATYSAGAGFRGAYRGLHPLGDQLDIDAEADRWGFGFVRGAYDFLKAGEQSSGFPVSPMVGVHVPWWIIGLLSSILPMQFLMKHRLRSHRSRRCCCIGCGYDLRASTDRCPECGRLVASTTTSDH